MSGNNYLADTNCYIYLLGKKPQIESFTNANWAFSFITEIELLSKKDITKKEESVIRQMLDTCQRVGHAQAITESTIEFRRKYQLKIPDAIIAATAHSLQVPLLTADKAFAKIKEIDCVVFDLL